MAPVALAHHRCLASSWPVTHGLVVACPHRGSWPLHLDRELRPLRLMVALPAALLLLREKEKNKKTLTLLD